MNLIQQCINGDPKAQKAFFLEHSPLLYNISRRYTSTQQDAEDVLQEAWINIFKNLHKYRDEGRLHGWLKRIVVNVALRQQNHSWKKVLLQDEPIQVNGAAVMSSVMDQMEVEDMMKQINHLSAGYREIFKLYVIDQFDHNEIGEMLGIQASTSRAKLSIARKKLKLLIKESQKVYHI